MESIRILHIMNNFADSSISRIVERIVSILGNQAYEWHVSDVSGYGEMEARLNALGVKTVHFSPQQDQGAIVKHIRNYVQEHQIQIVHSHTPRTIVSTFRAIAGVRRGGRPRHVATKHLLTSWKDRRWGILYALFDYMTLYMPERLVPVSEGMAKHVTALPGISRDKVTAIQNAIPCDSFYQPEKRPASRLDLGLAPEQLVFGYSGRLDLVKRIDLLLQAFAQVHAVQPQARLLLIGEGTEDEELKTLASHLGIASAVIWTGYRAGTEIPELLAAIDVYVQPSHNEGLSLSILEAMAAGKAVIATNVGGALEVLHQRETGLVIPALSTPDALVSAMQELSTDPELRARIAEAGQKHVFEEFGIQKMVDAYASVYHSMMN
jgi:glycosyltransferase involved in cell wall biosynthesis